MSSSLLFRKLRPFILICQINGLVPFSAKIDPVTGRFRKFEFSVKSFIFWWYSLVTFFQIVGYILLLTSLIRKKNLEVETGLPTAVSILLLSAQFIFSLQIFMCRIDVLKYKRFKRIINLLIEEVETYFFDLIPDFSQGSIYARTILGIFLAFLTVSCF